MKINQIIMAALGAFLGILAITMFTQGVTAHTPPPAGPGDWIIPNGDTTIITNDAITLEGDLIVKPLGELILNTVTLKFDCSTDGEFGFYNYGSLNVDANSALASVTDELKLPTRRARGRARWRYARVTRLFC